uniref:Tudor domain-containing protein n=1 Tax=Ditylenchus dipsaci TaxID=166011 RepID=A0A915ECD3_9BILA
MCATPNANLHHLHHEGLQSKPKESLCGFCAFKNHKSHNLIEAADFASEKYHQKVTDEIKKLVSTTTPGVKLLAEGFKKIEFDLGQAFEEFYDIPDQLSKLSNANSQFKIYSKADLANNLDVMRSTKELTTKACRDLERIQKLLKENIMDFSLIARIYSLDLAEKLKALMKSEKAAINPDKNVNNSHRDREAAGPSNLTVKEKIPSKGSIWKLNEIIMCKCTKTASFYKAKIVDVFQYDDDIAYQVHYLGWSNRHDERIAGSQTNILFRKYIEEADYISFTNRHKKKRKADEVALEITHKRFNRIESVTPPRSPKRKDSSAKKAPVYLIDDDSD